MSELDEIKRFDLECNEFVGGKYLLADKKIADILRSIAASERLLALVATCLRDFEFAKELQKATVRHPKKRLSLRLPSDKSKTIAFAVCLLTEIDSRSRNFIDLLGDYFGGDEDMHEAYDNFAARVIIPFNKAVLDLVSETDSRSDFFDEGCESLPYDAKELEGLQEALADITAEINREHSLSRSERDEMLVVTDALSQAVLGRNIRFIKILFIGAKNTAATSTISKRLMPLFDMLFKRLRSCGVI